MKVFIINGGQHFAHSGGKFQETLTGWSATYFKNIKNAEVRITNINDAYDPQEEVKNYVWADVIVYHVPVWWFQVPYELKKYFDTVFTAGHQNGIYKSDGRSRSYNPKLHYGTGGLLHGRKYMLTTSWNAPTEAFTEKREFFDLQDEDTLLMGVHKMNEFIGLRRIEGFHFHELEKEVTPEKIEADKNNYLAHLGYVFGSAI